MAEPLPESFRVDGAAGEPTPLPLALGPATGHSWILDLPPGVRRVEDTPASPIEVGRELGAAHGGMVQVTAPPGRHLIRARLARPWDPDDAVRVVHVELNVT